MKKNRFHIFFFCFLLGFTGISTAQNFEQQRREIIQRQINTRTEIDELNERISAYEERLQKTSRRYTNLYEQYENQQRLIALRDEKISKLETEQAQIEAEIGLINRTIAENQRQIDRLIDNYKKTLQYIYKHGKTSELALLFASSSINQVLIRAYYLEKFDNYREGQVNAIENAEKELRRNRVELKQVQITNDHVLVDIRREKENLAEKKREQENDVALLRQDKQKLQQRIDQIKGQKQSLNNTLTELTEEEEKVRRAQANRVKRQEAEREQKLTEAENISDDEERAREVAKYSAPAASEEFLGEEQLERIELSFAQNKGQLPWPVESSTISEHFGRRRHPVYGTVTPNLGIEIVTKARESVRAVHPGYVIAIQPFPGYGDVVLVKHGRFITAYGNLSQVSVRDGTVLDQGEEIGLAGDEDSTKGESVFFLVREDNQNLDPENWLLKK